MILINRYYFWFIKMLVNSCNRWNIKYLNVLSERDSVYLITVPTSSTITWLPIDYITLRLVIIYYSILVTTIHYKFIIFY